MTDKRIKYAEICRIAAAHFDDVAADYPSELRDGGAALRSLAALVERAEKFNEWEQQGPPASPGAANARNDYAVQLTLKFATGYAPTDPKEGESNALRPQQDDNFGYGQ